MMVWYLREISRHQNSGGILKFPKNTILSHKIIFNKLWNYYTKDGNTMYKNQIKIKWDINGNNILSWNPISLIKTIKTTIMVQTITQKIIIIQGD